MSGAYHRSLPVLRVPGPFGALALSQGIAGNAIRARRLAEIKEREDRRRTGKSLRGHLIVAIAIRRLQTARTTGRPVPVSLVRAVDAGIARRCGACISVRDLLERNGVLPVEIPSRLRTDTGAEFGELPKSG